MDLSSSSSFPWTSCIAQAELIPNCLLFASRVDVCFLDTHFFKLLCGFRWEYCPDHPYKSHWLSLMGRDHTGDLQHCSQQRVIAPKLTRTHVPFQGVPFSPSLCGIGNNIWKLMCIRDRDVSYSMTCSCTVDLKCFGNEDGTWLLLVIIS